MQWSNRKTKELGRAAAEQFRALYADERVQRDELAGRRLRILCGYDALDRKIKQFDLLAREVASIVEAQIETYQTDLESERDSRTRLDRQALHLKA